VDNVFYVAYDADSAGSKIGQAIISDNPQALEDASNRIQLGNEIIARWAKKWKGIQYSSGGDQGLFALPPEALHELEMVRADYEHATGLTISVGVGTTLSESGKALIVAKFWGKNMVVQYSPEVEKEIESANAKISEGSANFEEQKLGTAYLQPEEMVIMGKEDQPNPAAQEESGHADCPYCQAMEQEGVEDPDHCEFCHDDEATDCPFCKENAEHDPNAEGHPEDCPLCAEAAQEGSSDVGGDDHSVADSGGPQTQLPTTTSSQDFAGQALDTPDLPKPDAISENPDEVAFNPETETNENRRLDEEGDEESSQAAIPGDEESSETVQSIVDDVESLPPTESQARQEQAQIDDANLAVGDNMEDGVSRPEDYESNVPGDMGLAEDEGDDSPDLGSVLQEGLDSHADNIQREKVIQLAAEALEGFKGCKDILEKAKEQAPQLYEASIAMLKAMIEMAKMLGLDQEAQEHAGADGDQSMDDQLGAPLGDEGGMEITDEGSPEYEPHPESAAANGAAPGEAPQEETPDYEPHPEKAAASEDAAPGSPKSKGQLASP
jgi:hypothetical protein